MRPFTLLIACLLFFSCSEDSNIFDPPSDASVQYRETDWNFVARVIHPPQEVEVQFGDGLRARIPFSAAILVKYATEIKGDASVGRSTNEWQIKPRSVNYGCEDGGMRIVFEALLRSRMQGSVWENREVIISLGSSDTNTDNPECLIWDIKDSDGNAMASFVAEGRISIKNSDCEDTR